MSEFGASDLQTLLLSLKTAGVATLVAGVAGLAFALLMAGRHFRGKALLDALLLAPLVLPPTVIGYLLLVAMGSGSLIGAVTTAFFGETLLFTWTSAVLASAVVAMPLMYRTTRAALEQADPSLAAAARTLGASELRVIRRISLPLARPGILAGLVLTFARAFGEFGATLMIAGNLPGRTRTLPLAIYTDVESGDLAHAGMWVAVTLVLTLVLAWLANVFAMSRRSPSSVMPVPAAAEPPRAMPKSVITPLMPRKALHARIVSRVGPFVLDVDLDMPKRPTAILGPSGAGKSLLLRCLSGLVRPDAGLIRLGERTLFDGTRGVDVRSRERRVGHLFQNYALFPHMTVRENVHFGAAATTANQWLEDLDLMPFAHRLPHELSGGQAQRAALARAMATAPDLLLLDEPLSALDTHLRSRVEQRLLETTSAFGGAVLMVTHNLEEAFRLSDDLIVLSAGKVLTHGPKHQVLAAPGTVVAAALTGCKNIVPAQWTGLHLDVPDWGIQLQIVSNVVAASHVGVRAHHVKVERGTSPRFDVNCLEARLILASETPHRMTLLFSLGGPVPLQVEVLKSAWDALLAAAGPWRVTLPKDQLLLLRGE